MSENLEKPGIKSEDFRRLFSGWGCELHVSACGSFGVTLNFSRFNASLVCPVYIWDIWRYQSTWLHIIHGFSVVSEAAGSELAQDTARIQPFSKGLEQESAPRMKFDSCCKTQQNNLTRFKWPNSGCSLVPSPDIRWEGGQAEPGGLGR